MAPTTSPYAGQRVDIVEMLAAIVRGDAIGADSLASVDPALFCDQAAAHGVLPLVADRLGSRADSVPAPLHALLRTQAGEAAVAELLQEVELKQVLVAFDAAGIRAILFKGSHLAYTHYSRPDLRPRIDTDVLVRDEARGAVHAAVLALGYEVPTKPGGELATGQRSYHKRRDGAVVHSLDVHWKVASPIVFAHVLSYDELAARAVAVPALGAGALGPCDAHALFIACVHRVAHHLDAVQLNWLYDIHLVAGRLDAGGWARFVDLAVERQVAAVCRRSLDRAAHAFHTNVPAETLHGLRRAEEDADERSSAYLKSRSLTGALVDDLRTLTTWRDRWGLVREHVFPPADYMRRAYAPVSAMPGATSRTMPLPLLYVWRFLRGARKWLDR